MGGCFSGEEKAAVETQTLKVHNKKVIVVGPSSVGKTTIIQQIIAQKLNEGATVKADQYKKNYDITVNNQKQQLCLNIWDTPGAEEFANLRDHDYRGADVCIMVYSIDKESTLEKMNEIHELAA